METDKQNMDFVAWLLIGIILGMIFVVVTGCQHSTIDDYVKYYKVYEYDGRVYCHTEFFEQHKTED